MIASCNGKYKGLEVNGAERTTIIVDIFNIIIQKVRDTGIHLKVDEEPKKSSRGPQKRSERQICCLKKNLNASRPSEHPPVREKNVKTFRWDHRLQIPPDWGMLRRSRCVLIFL